MFNELEKYTHQNSFKFSINDALTKVCNAPSDKNGIYIIYAQYKDKVELVYIGISGTKQRDGSIKTRKGGIRDRIVNGKRDGILRRKFWLEQMQLQNIISLNFHWYITYNEEILDFPEDIETLLLQKFHIQNGRLPIWNREF